MKNRVLTALAAATLLSSPGLACDFDDDDGRLDVGLVLSGGGALASTHIGVLAVLEEEGVPVHCIVGTSMGSVVGGLYAAGWSPDEMRAEFEAADWPRLIQNSRDRDELPFREKDRQDEYFSDYIAGWSPDGVILPSSVTTLRGLQGFYRRMLDDAPPSFDFDHLPIPYRAVATDLGTGQAAIISEGDLVEAMLASMSVPGLFDPREIDGRLYVDGGLSKQLPVDVAYALGADVVIVVDTTIEPSDPPASPSVVQVAQQIIQVQVWTNRTEQAELLQPGDILIRPDLSMLTTGSFERAGDGFESGVAASAPYRARMQEIAATASPPLVSPNAVMARSQGGERTVTRVAIDNETRVSDAMIAARLGIEAGDSVSRDDVEEGLREIAGLESFGTIDAGFEADGTLTVRARDRHLGDDLFQAGITLSNTFNQDSRYVIRARYARRPLNSAAGEFAVSAAIGSEFQLAAEWLQPFGREGRFFTEVEGGYLAQPLALDFDGFRLDDYWVTQFYADARLGRDLGRWGLLALEVGYANGTYETTLVGPGFNDEALEVARYGVTFDIDTLDHPDFPSSGFSVSAEAFQIANLNTQFGIKGDTYTRYHAQGRFAFGSERWGGVANLEGGQSDDPGVVLQSLFFLGGFRNLSAYSERGLPNNEYWLASVETYRRLTSSDAVGALPIYVGALVEYSEFTFDLSQGNIYSQDVASITGYGAMNTLIGPAYLGVSFGDRGNKAIFLYIGRNF